MPVDLSLLDLAPVQPREAPVSFTYEKWVAAGKPCLRQSCGHPHPVPPGVATAQITDDLQIAEGTVTPRLHFAVRALRLSLQTQPTFSWRP
jgi:hypothetical protein